MNKKTDNRSAEVSYIEKLVMLERVTKVVKGGKRFSFLAFMIVGDGRGRVGFGKGKAREVADAMRKASDSAKKSMIKVPLRESRTLHYDLYGSYCSGKVVLRSAVPGTGIISGGAMRAIFEALGIQDVVSKCIGSDNPLNMVRATFAALSSSVSPRFIANKRGKKIGEITFRRV